MATMIDPRLHRIAAAQPYPLLFATISGAHLYGFPSPDSDYDLRGASATAGTTAHLTPALSPSDAEREVGQEVRDETVEETTRVAPHPGPLPIGCGEGDALEMDIVRCLRTATNVQKFFGLLLKKNGYVLEQLYSPLIVHTTPEHDELKEICRPSPRRRSSRGDEAHSSSGKSQSLPRNGRDGFHSVPDFSFEDGDAVERVPTNAFLGPMQQPAAVALTLLTSAPTGVVTNITRITTSGSRRRS
jgi:hypothetical protein